MNQNGFDLIIRDKNYTIKEQSSKISELKDEIRQLEEFRDNLKCCNNCKKYYECKTKYYCGYCKAWKYDGIKQKDRKID